MATKTNIKEFEAIFPQLKEDLLQWAKAYNPPQKCYDWFKKSLETNVPGGKYNRGMSVPDSVSILLDRPLTKEEYFQAATLGWLVEFLQGFFLVADDIMDASVTRRGQPCWYRQEGVGMVAINDAFMIEAAIYELLKKHFRSHPCYVDMIETFHDISLVTEFGQMADLLTAPEGVVNLEHFSLEIHKFIVIYKTAYYSFYLPVVLALQMLNIATPKNLQQAKDILIPMGEYFQVQDDYLDGFGHPDVIGKIGTDIQDNKCSWLINQACSRATPEQRQILQDNYGRKSDECVAVVKKLYCEMKLEEIYHEYEENTVKDLKAKMTGLDESEGLKKQVFDAFLSKIYKRQK